MKSHCIRSIVVSTLFAGCLLAAEAPAKPDATGVWTATFEGRDGQTRTFETTLIQEGSKLTGQTRSFRGQPVKLSEGKVEGDKVSFKVVRESPRGAFTLNYSGKLAGDTIKGTMSGKRGDRTFEREWTIKRKPANPVGKWAWSMKRDNGETWEAILVIKKEGAKLTGEIGREDADWKMPLKDVQLKGSTLTFKTIFNRNGEETVIKNRAVIAGKTMKGKAGGLRDGQEWSREWKATKK